MSWFWELKLELLLASRMYAYEYSLEQEQKLFESHSCSCMKVGGCLCLPAFLEATSMVSWTWKVKGNTVQTIASYACKCFLAAQPSSREGLYGRGSTPLLVCVREREGERIRDPPKHLISLLAPRSDQMSVPLQGQHH